MAVATKMQLPYLENTGLDMKKLYTPKEWTERFRHNRKRIHNIDIKQILKDETLPTDKNWNTKQPGIRQDIIRTAGPSAIEIITSGEFNTDPDAIKTDNFYNYFENTTCQRETPITAVEISSGQSKKTTRQPKITGNR